MTQAEKDPTIETLRGLAILLVVAGYIVHDDLKRAADPTPFVSALNFVYYWLAPIRIPLFTVISAYLYAASPASPGTVQRLVQGKARRILIPFAVVSAVQYAVLSLIPVNGPRPLHEIYTVYFWPYEQLWFLFSIFCIFAVVGAMDAMKLMETPRRWLACLAVALAIHVTVQAPRLFSLNGTNYLLPFFILGYGMRRFETQLFSPAMVRLYAAVAVAAYAAHAARYANPASLNFMNGAAHRVLTLAVTFSAVPLLFHFRRNVPALATVGAYAFGIHLFNKIGLVPVKALCLRLGVENDAVLFFSYFSGSVALAIAIQRALEKSAAARTYVLGLKAPAGEARVALPNPRFLPQSVLKMATPAFVSALIFLGALFIS